MPYLVKISKFKKNWVLFINIIKNNFGDFMKKNNLMAIGVVVFMLAAKECGVPLEQ